MIWSFSPARFPPYLRDSSWGGKTVLRSRLPLTTVHFRHQSNGHNNENAFKFLLPFQRRVPYFRCYHRREAAPKFEHFDRFREGARSGAGSDGGSGGTPRAGSPASSPPVNGSATVPVTKNNHIADRTHPHFFHGLGPNARKLFMELYAENRSRLLAPISRNIIAHSTTSSTASSGQYHHPEQMSSAAPPDGSSLPNTVITASGSQQSSQQLPQQASPRSVAGNSSFATGPGGGGGAAANVRHAAGAFAAAGPPPDLDAGIMDRYGVLLMRLTEAAIRIQRARRLGGMLRAARRLRRRQRAVLAVQRVFRGHLGRRYVDCIPSGRLHAQPPNIGRTFALEVKLSVFLAPGAVDPKPMLFLMFRVANVLNDKAGPAGGIERNSTQRYQDRSVYF